MTEKFMLASNANFLRGHPVRPETMFMWSNRIYYKYKFTNLDYIGYANSKYGTKKNFYNDSKSIFVPQKTFAVNIGDMIYLHFLVFQISHYELLKQEEPDLNIIFFHLGDEQDLKNILQKNIYLNDFFTIYNINLDQVYYIENNNIVFEQLLIPSFHECYGVLDLIPNEVNFNHSDSTISEVFYKKQKLEKRMHLVTRKIKKYLTSNNKDLKKIYISRKNGNKKAKESYIKYLNELDSLPYPLFDNEWFRYRYYPPEEEQKLEDFFKDLGYTIVYLENLSFIEQANLFYNATHIAGLSGTAFLNLYFCKPETKTFILEINSFHHNWGQEILEALDLDIYYLPINYQEHKETRKIFMAENIIKEIKENVLNLL